MRPVRMLCGVLDMVDDMGDVGMDLDASDDVWPDGDDDDDADEYRPNPGDGEVLLDDDDCDDR